MFKKIINRLLKRLTPTNNIEISDNLDAAGRIIYVLLLVSEKKRSPWYLNEIIKQTLAIPMETAIACLDKYPDTLDVSDKELAGRLIYAVKKMTPDKKINDTVKPVIRASLSLPTSLACAYARALDNYIDLRTYITYQHLNFIEKEVIK